MLFIPGLVDIVFAPRWALLSVAIPLFLIGRQPKNIWPVVLFLAWCSITLLWSVSPLNSIDALWKFTVLGLCFALGTTLTEIEWRNCLLAFVVGVAVNGSIAIAQVSGFDPIPQVQPPAGTYLNKNFLAEAGLMALAGLLALSLPSRWSFPKIVKWPLAGLCATAAFMPISRNVIGAATVLVSMWLWKRSRVASLSLACAALVLGALTFFPDFWRNSLGTRVSMWVNVLAHSNVFGFGLGSFSANYPAINDVVPTGAAAFDFQVRPNSAHNDLVTLLHDLGWLGVCLAGVLFGFVHRRAHGPAAWLLASFVLLGIGGFPLYTPTAFVAALAAGHLCRPREHLCRSHVVGAGSVQ